MRNRFPSNWKEYDRSDSFSFIYEQNLIIISYQSNDPFTHSFLVLVSVIIEGSVFNEYFIEYRLKPHCAILPWCRRGSRGALAAHLSESCTPDPCESHPHRGHLVSKPNYRRFPSYLLWTLLLFPIHLLPSPMHSTGFSFYIFPGFLAMFTSLSSNNNNNNNWSQNRFRTRLPRPTIRYKWRYAEQNSPTKIER